MTLSELLFYGGELRVVLEQQAAGMAQEVERIPEDHLLQADVAEVAQALAARWGVDTPVLLRDEMYQDDPKAVGVDVSHDFMRVKPIDGRPAIAPGYQVRIRIPFEGDSHVFSLQAREWGMNPPRATIGRNELTDVIEYPADAPVNIGQYAKQLADSIDKYLVFSARDIEQFNAGLEQQAHQALETRKARVVANRQHVEATGLPTRRPDRSKPQTYIADVLARRPAPELPASKSEPIALEPVLDDEIFEHILSVIRSSSEAMENSPGTYAGMGEEDRRQVLLSALNTHYRGMTTAEAFNVSGKTDLLVKHEGQNLFIAECKNWDGVKSFTGAVDQLFDYAAWRDTKLAIVMFVSPRDLTTVLERATNGLREHDQFVKWKNAATETELRAVMSARHDPRRFADLNVFFVHLP